MFDIKIANCYNPENLYLFLSINDFTFLLDYNYLYV